VKTKPTRASRSNLPPSRGGLVCAWIEEYLVHSEGDLFGQPFRLTPDQKATIFRAYELGPGGHRKHRRVLYGRPKGFGKTELAAAIALAELAGPVAPPTPNIPVAAASFEQADLLFGAARTMVNEGPLAEFLDTFDTEILIRDRPGSMYRVAAVAGTNDGGRPTFLVCDELHEWIGRRERVHLVLSNGLAKRRDSWELLISTAGSEVESELLLRLYKHGRLLASGELADPTFGFDWQEHPDPDCDLADEQAVRDAVAVAYRNAGEHVDVERIVSRFREIPEYEWRRYFLNQWTATPEQWLPSGSWEACADPTRTVPDGANIVLGFDGSYNNDSTALVGCTIEERPHVFVVGCWERPEAARDWIVPRDAVDSAVQAAMARWKVRELLCDPPGWHREIDEWADRYAGAFTVMYPTNQRALMSAACSKFYTAVVNGQLTHDGDPRLARHLTNAVVKETPQGVLITKERKMSPRKIDLAVAAIIGFDRALEPTPSMPVFAWGDPWF
jgi:phage terminase large subunit-like protein